MPAAASPSPARIEYLRVRNFRALRNIELKNLTPLTVLLGPNGSGKSTIFDMFAFLAECFESGLRRAWDKRGRAKELKTRGTDGPLVIEMPLSSPDLLAVNALGQFQDHPRVGALRNLIMGWHLSYLSADSTRGQPEAGPHERLTKSGDNLANVIQYLGERHPERLDRIFETLRKRVPRIERVLADTMQDGRLLLQIKDAPFRSPVLARFASDGTLKMLACLVLIYDPAPPPFIGIEEPENHLQGSPTRPIASGNG